MMLLKALPLAIACSLVGGLSYGQDSLTNDILTTLKFRRGIYRTAWEFKSNTPSQGDEFEVRIDTGKYDRYILYQSGKKVRGMYGFCDGDYLYINAKVYGQSNYFVRLLVLGPIIYFEDKRAKSNKVVGAGVGTSVGFGLIGAAVVSGAMATTMTYGHPGWIIYVPDSDGQAYAFDKQSLSSIFEEADTALLRSFEKEKKQLQDPRVLMKYMLEFNQRAGAGILPEK